MKKLSQFSNLNLVLLFIAASLSLPQKLLADSPDSLRVNYINNMDLLSDDYEKYKDVKLSWKDQRSIRDECSKLSLKPDSHRDCIISFKKLALAFEIDAKICNSKAKRLAMAHKNKVLVLIDEDDQVREFIIKEGIYSRTIEYEKCMELMKWKDSENFRYGKFD